MKPDHAFFSGTQEFLLGQVEVDVDHRVKPDEMNREGLNNKHTEIPAVNILRFHFGTSRRLCFA